MSEEFIRLKVPPKAEVLFNFANEPTFPICVLEFEEDEEGERTSSKIRVKKMLNQQILDQYDDNKVLLYCTIPKGYRIRFGAFSPDMQESYSLLAELKLVSSLEEWVNKSQDYIEKYLTEDEK